MFNLVINKSCKALSNVIFKYSLPGFKAKDLWNVVNVVKDLKVSLDFSKWDLN